LADDLDLLPTILGGGDDYELLFTASGRVGDGATEIGEVVAGAGVKVLDRDGAEIAVSVGGFQHF
jgi:thiamine-monophosphate kinase